MKSNRSRALADPAFLSPPVSFGYKTAWFAIRSDDTKAVAIALELQDVRLANWQYGINLAVDSSEYVIFVAPPVNGWTLAVGLPILYEADDHAMERATEVSGRFGEVQFFSSMRVSSSYLWFRASNRNVIRLFYEAEGERRELGEQTDAERALGVSFFDGSSPESKDPRYWERKDLVYPDEEHVLKIAGIWSVDPSKLDESGLAPSLGLLGKPSSSYPPKPQPSTRRKPGLIQRLLGG